MNINSTIITKILDIQKEKKSKDNDYYNYNKFLVFILSLQNKKAATINALLKELSFKEEEIKEYIKTLKEEGLLSVEDISFVEKLNGNFKSKNFKQEMEEILAHLNRVAKKRFTLNKETEKRLKSLLETGNYIVSDFKKLHVYFNKTWGADPKMAMYLRPQTLYNQKFDNRVQESQSFFDELNEYKKQIQKICGHFPQLISMEIYPKDKLIAEESQQTKNLCQEMPLSLQTTIVHWLKMNYTETQIIEVIEGTIEQWSKKPELAKHISISKILDNRFPERAQAVERLKNKGMILKSGVVAAEAWLQQTNTSEGELF